jgi:hypothetical protein
MVNVHGMARLGVLAVGLGIGAAWAQTPVASADASGDWLSSIDGLLSGASPAAATPLICLSHSTATPSTTAAAAPTPAPSPGITAWRSRTATAR